MANKIILIPPVSDCSYIDIEYDLAMCINNCFTNNNVFKISNTITEEELPLLTYDYKTRKWLTGRYIGKLFFQYNKKEYCFEVKPRFGNAAVMHLLEEIFNIKLAESNTSDRLSQKKHNELIKKLISLIWVKKLSKTNVHGLPKYKINKQYKANTVKGRIDIKKTILPLYNEQQIVSKRTEKQIDVTVLTILQEAYKILCKHYYLSQNMLTDNVKDVINTNLQTTNNKKITFKQYQNIKYGAIYANYKNIVDISWNIMQRNQNNPLQDFSNTSGDAVFLDMAEIWEMYLMSILKKEYTGSGWKVFSKKFTLYNQQYFRRGIIPDLIIEKENDVVIFDAKYKKMKYQKWDYDRSDFFQIHTYGAFMKESNKNLIGIGLLYPFNDEITQDHLNKNFSKGLYGNTNSETWFKVDGITLSENLSDLHRNKNQFLTRVNTLLS